MYAYMRLLHTVCCYVNCVYCAAWLSGSPRASWFVADKVQYVQKGFSSISIPDLPPSTPSENIRPNRNSFIFITKWIVIVKYVCRTQIIDLI
jgi:hypothetical protein